MPRMKVAVKVLAAHGLAEQARHQFSAEANAMAQLADHPHIVQVFRADISPDGRPFLVMKYYPQPNLAQRARGERFSVPDVLRIGIQVASAVEAAHRIGILHRDIKPANILTGQYGTLGLTDFGIAATKAQAVAGQTDGISIPWAAPEVLFSAERADERSDVYSIAATLWHLLVGRSPFDQRGGDNSAVALMHRITSSPAPPTGRGDVPPSFERLLHSALAKDPSARPATALAFARALQAVEQEQRLARPARRPETTAPGYASPFVSRGPTAANPAWPSRNSTTIRPGASSRPASTPRRRPFRHGSRPGRAPICPPTPLRYPARVPPLRRWPPGLAAPGTAGTSPPARRVVSSSSC
jgi:serine/threonine protein kinase